MDKKEKDCIIWMVFGIIIGLSFIPLSMSVFNDNQIQSNSHCWLEIFERGNINGKVFLIPNMSNAEFTRGGRPVCDAVRDMCVWNHTGGYCEWIEQSATCECNIISARVA